MAKVFDDVLFMKLVRLADSSEAGERNLALERAGAMCAGAKVTFYETVTRCFGVSSKQEIERISRELRAAQESKNRAEVELRDYRDRIKRDYKDAISDVETLTAQLLSARQEAQTHKRNAEILAQSMEDKSQFGGNQPQTMTSTMPEWLSAEHLLITACVSIIAEWVLPLLIGRGSAYHVFGHSLTLALLAAWTMKMLIDREWRFAFSRWLVMFAGWFSLLILQMVMRHAGTVDMYWTAPENWFKPVWVHYKAAECITVAMVLGMIVDFNYGLPLSKRVIAYLSNAAKMRKAY